MACAFILAMNRSGAGKGHELARGLGALAPGPDRLGRWELLVRRPGALGWFAGPLACAPGDADVWLDAGPRRDPVPIRVCFAALRAAVVAEVARVERGAGVPMPAAPRRSTLERLRGMARSPMWTMARPPRGRGRGRELRRQAYVLAVREGVVPRPTLLLGV